MGRFVPGQAGADRDVERNVELVGGTHLAAHEVLDGLMLARGDLEDEFVVNLQQQA